MAGPFSSSDERNYLGIGKQTVKGTGVAPTLFLPYQGSLSVDHGADGDDVHEAGTGPYVSRSQKTKHDPSGSGGLAWRPKTCGTLAAWFLGADAVTGAGPYVHTSTPAQSFPWLSVERNIADEVIERFTDSVLTKFVIEHDGNKDLMATVDWMALAPSWQTSATVETYETGLAGTVGAPFRGSQAVFTIDGAAASCVTTWKLELEWKYADDIRCSDVVRGDTLKLELTGKLTTKELFRTADAYRAGNYGSTTGTAAARAFTSGSFSAVYDNALAGASNRKVGIDVKHVEWGKVSVTEPNPEGEEVYVEREGTVQRVVPDAFVSIISTTGDSAVYL